MQEELLRVRLGLVFVNGGEDDGCDLRKTDDMLLVRSIRHV